MKEGLAETFLWAERLNGKSARCMPRLACLDAPGGLHHIMIQEIALRPIFISLAFRPAVNS
jgi:hypothetical protein